jgi:hypothetical protein
VLRWTSLPTRRRRAVTEPTRRGQRRIKSGTITTAPSPTATFKRVRLSLALLTVECRGHFFVSRARQTTHNVR